MKKDLASTSNFDKVKLPFQVQSIRNSINENDEVNESIHTHNHYEMIWLAKGSGTLFINMRQYSIEKNMMFCLKPNQAHCFQSNSPIEGFTFSFTDSFFTMGEHEFDWSGQANLFQLFSASPVINIPNEMEAEIEEIILTMKKEYESVYAFRTQLLRRYFRILLLYLARLTEEKNSSSIQSKETELVNSYLNMVDKNFKTKKLVADYAEKLLVTPNYLNGIVKKNTGYSAGYHIRERVVLEAKRMSRYTDAGMKEIAYSLGFLDIGHFSKFFKSVSGINFSDFKKEGLNISLFNSFNRA